MEQLGLEFPILYDESGDVVRSYGVFSEGSGYAIPSTFIIDAEGVVRWEFIGSDSHVLLTQCFNLGLMMLPLCRTRHRNG